MLRRKLGEAIKKARQNRKLSQEAVAKAAGMARTSVSNIEKGNQGLSVEALYAIADALDVEAASLLPSRAELSASPLVGTISGRNGATDATISWLERIASKHGG